MTNSKKILITTESREIFIVRFNRKTGVRGYCAECARETEMMTLDEAVSLTFTATREMIRQIDAGKIHALETASGHLLICRNSLEITGEQI